jgi:hypothetical protein
VGTTSLECSVLECGQVYFNTPGPYVIFSALGVALNITTANVQLRVLHNSVYLSARLKL